MLFIVCCVGRRAYGCKRLDSVISLPTSGIAKQHKRDTGGNGPVSYQLRTSCLFQRAQVVCHIRLETACSQHAQGEELSAWSRSKSEVLPTFIVSQDLRSCYKKVWACCMALPQDHTIVQFIYIYSAVLGAIASRLVEHLVWFFSVTASLDCNS